MNKYDELYLNITNLLNKVKEELTNNLLKISHEEETLSNLKEEKAKIENSIEELERIKRNLTDRTWLKLIIGLTFLPALGVFGTLSYVKVYNWINDLLISLATWIVFAAYITLAHLFSGDTWRDIFLHNIYDTNQELSDAYTLNNTLLSIIENKEKKILEETNKTKSLRDLIDYLEIRLNKCQLLKQKSLEQIVDINKEEILNELFMNDEKVLNIEQEIGMIRSLKMKNGVDYE